MQKHNYLFQHTDKDSHTHTQTCRETRRHTNKTQVHTETLLHRHAQTHRDIQNYTGAHRHTLRHTEYRDTKIDYIQRRTQTHGDKHRYSKTHKHTTDTQT